MRAVRHVAAALLAAMAVASTSAGSAGEIPVTVEGTALAARQVGAGYERLRELDGRGVRYVTLDLCGYLFTSERLRTDRVQLTYGAGARDVTVSNEVVTYQENGVRKALTELRKAIAKCPSTPVSSPVSGGPKREYRVRPLARGDSKLLPRAVAFEVEVSFVSKGKRVGYTAVAVYQTLGNVLSGIYAYGGTHAKRVAVALRAAEQSASNVRRYVRLVPRTA